MPADRRNTLIERWDEMHPRWAELMNLPDVDDLHVETKMQEWHLALYTLVALEDADIAGVLRFWTQRIGVDEDKPPFTVDGAWAVEAKAVTFHVVPSFRARGIGRALQFALVEWARELGCYQLRSRSPYSSIENHALKASLGFGVSPGRDRPDGARDTAFFVLPLRMDQELLGLLSSSEVSA